MDATTYELRSILGNERRFLIPTFQRDYEWTEKGQWQLLFDDLVATAGRLATARAQAEYTGESVAKAEKRVAPHFLGAVVLDQLPSKAGQLDRRAVIDGQQRLTTIQLLLRALADVAAEAGSSRVKSLERLIFNPVDDPAAEADSQYKLWPRRHDRECWRSAMDTDPVNSPTDHLYGQARAYFAKRARAAIAAATTPDDRGDPTVGLDDIDPVADAVAFGDNAIADEVATGDATQPVTSIDLPSPEAVDLDTLLDAATVLFKLVSIDLDDNDDAQVIFEVLNGRQTPLSAADLVKNLLFLRAEVADEAELEALHDTYWKPLESRWWKVSIGRGHAARQRRELLLAAWLTAQTGTEASVGHLYGEIRHYVIDQERKVADLLTEIADYGDAYARVATADPAVVGVRTAAAYRHINLLGVTTAQPLLLWLETRPSGLLTSAERELAVAGVESWVVRRLLAKRNTRGYAKVMIAALNAAKTASATVPADGAAIVEAVLDALDDAKLTWPSNDDLASVLVTERFYDYHSAGRVRMVLAAIDRHLVGKRPKSEQYVVDYDKLQIEHLMPQSWQTHWPLDADEPEPVAAEMIRSTAIQSLGNLTLVTPYLNPSLSNSSWGLKQPEIWQHSKTQLNSQFSGDIANWNESTIASRGAALAAQVIAIWPSVDQLRQTVTGMAAQGEE